MNLNEEVVEDADIILKNQTTVEEKTADQSTGVINDDEIIQDKAMEEEAEMDLEGDDVNIADDVNVQNLEVQDTAEGTAEEVAKDTDMQHLITPRTLDFEEDVGPSNPVQ